MEDIIKRIIDIDTREQKMLEGERLRREKAERELVLRREEIRREYAEMADARIKEIRLEEETKAEMRLKEKSTEIEKQLEGLESRYQAKKDEWVAAIFERVTRDGAAQ